jgi:glycosyltransferase involved in cell wall biosynthesis
MIKILYIIACLKTGGSEKYLLNMIKNLDKDRYQVTVWCEGAWGPTGDEIRKAGAAVVQRPLRPGRPDQLLGGIRYMRRNRFDIVHSLKYNTNFMDALVSKASRVKVFITSRRNLPFWINSDRIRNAERIRNALTDRVIANSEAVKELTIVVEKIPAEKISVIYTGIDLNEVDAVIKKSRSVYKDALGIPDSVLVIGTTGDLREAKGHTYLIKAFAEVVKKTEKDVYLVIQGEGPEESSLRSLAKELKIEDRVKIDTSPRDRIEVIWSFDIFVLSSLTERLSNAVIGAMALSLPCVVTDVGGNREVVVDNVTGFIVPARSVESLAEATLELVEDPALAKEFGAKGRDIVERKFTVQLMASEHQRLYEELLGKH